MMTYNMVKKLFSFSLFFFCLYGFAQNYSIQGKIIDQNKAPIPYANVVLKTSTDSLFIKGTSTNEMGLFEIENVNIENYILEVSYIGYSKHVTRIEVKNDLTLSEIILVEDVEELEGVTVTAKRPTVKRLVDRVVFNVENSTLSNNNVLDVLKNTPGVIVNDGSISIKNSTPTIYINDRRVHLSSSEVQQLLEGTSASNLKSIEVITNPPAKYDAEGGAVLNIVTSKKIIAGYNGSVFGNFKQGSVFPKYSFGTSHFFRTKKLNTYINYSISPRKEFRGYDEFVNFIDLEQTTSSWKTKFGLNSKTSNHNINANIEYELDKNNSLGFSTSMMISPREKTRYHSSAITEVFNNMKVLDSTFITDNISVDEKFNLAFGLDYIHKFKKNGEKLLFNAHYTDFDFSSFQNVDTDYLFPDESLIRSNQFQTFSSQAIKIYTGQVDYVLPSYGSGMFEAGVKIANINSKNILTQYSFKNGIKEQDFQNSDTFLYKETNYAAYLSYSKEWDSWNLKLGLRNELTRVEGNSLSNSTVNDTKYLKFFPTLYISNKLNDQNLLYINYSKRIYRPRYEQLNPFKYFLNDNTFITGDPNLKPQIDNQFILGYTFNQDYTFELYYRHENNPFLQYFYQDNGRNLLVYQYTNTDESVSYGLDFTTYVPLNRFWNLYFLSSIFHYKTNFNPIESNLVSFEGKQWSLYAEINNYFTLLKDKSLSIDVSFNYLSPTNDGPTDSSFVSSLDINLKKTFWQNKATFSLGVLDIFNTRNFNATTKYLNQDIFTKFQLENRLFVFGFNYKIGNLKLKNNKKSIDLLERDRLSKGN
ncbi:outer membrane beta-barrel family protein [Hyunsoonleella aestuarii]|nr:outer membrane beta-barrel family protein [Hyunsoonleella aestuarii]